MSSLQRFIWKWQSVVFRSNCNQFSRGVAVGRIGKNWCQQTCKFYSLIPLNSRRGCINFVPSMLTKLWIWCRTYGFSFTSGCYVTYTVSNGYWKLAGMHLFHPHEIKNILFMDFFFGLGIFLLADWSYSLYLVVLKQSGMFFLRISVNNRCFFLRSLIWDSKDIARTAMVFTFAYCS